MRRKDREIVDPSAIDEILHRADVCRLGLCLDGEPYIVPFNFGYEGGALYFHSARRGRKIEILEKNPRVCFEADIDHKIVESETSSEWTMKYRSVIGWGRITFVEDAEEKKRAYDILMRHYTDKKFTHSDSCLERSLILRLDIERMTGKSSGYE